MTGNDEDIGSDAACPAAADEELEEPEEVLLPC